MSPRRHSEMRSAAEESSFDDLADLQSQLKEELAMAKESQSALEVILSPGVANKTRNSENYFTSEHEVAMQDPSVSNEPTILKTVTVNSIAEVDTVLPSLKEEISKAKESQSALEFILTPIIASGDMSRHEVIAKIDTAKSPQDPSSLSIEVTRLSIQNKRNEVRPLVAGDNLSCDLIPEQNCTQQTPSTPVESTAIDAGFTSVEVYEAFPQQCMEESIGSDTERARKVMGGGVLVVAVVVVVRCLFITNQ